MILFTVKGIQPCRHIAIWDPFCGDESFLRTCLWHLFDQTFMVREKMSKPLTSLLGINDEYWSSSQSTMEFSQITHSNFFMVQLYLDHRFRQPIAYPSKSGIETWTT